MRLFLMSYLSFLLLLSCALNVHAEVTLEKMDGGVKVHIDGKPFTNYLEKSGTKPILWPIIGPTGKELTRAYPMAKVEGEKNDHLHHRSLWLTHGDVNKVSFWEEEGKHAHGKIEHVGYDKMESGSPAVMITRNEWRDEEGKVLCKDLRTYRFGGDTGSRWIELDAILTPADYDLTFGDTKEGAFGVRVAETMKVDAKLGGQIMNSEGQKDGQAWGKRAKWVDYHGPVQEETQGIAILNHPSSYGYPTYWHVRTYGLFAANPFGVHDFTAGKEPNGAHQVKKGETLRLRHRVIFHTGDEKEGKIAQAFEDYAKEE